MLMPSKMLHQSINKFVGKYLQYIQKVFIKALTNLLENTDNTHGAGLQHRASPVVSFSRIFFLYIRNTGIVGYSFFSFFFFF